MPSNGDFRADGEAFEFELTTVFVASAGTFDGDELPAHADNMASRTHKKIKLTVSCFIEQSLKLKCKAAQSVAEEF
jgi:hypothetical protein